MHLATRLSLLVSFVGLGLAAGCGDDGSEGSSGDPAQGEGASCARTSDCPSGQACLVYGGHGACTLTCSATATECRGEAECAGVGAAVDVCQPPDSPAVDEPSAEDPPVADEQPRLPCASDAECAALEAGLVCGTWQGTKDCTIVCSQKSQCNPPAVNGIAVEFFDCQTDEGDASRTVCLPDARCFDTADPMACISITIPSF